MATSRKQQQTGSSKVVTSAHKTAAIPVVIDRSREHKVSDYDTARADEIFGHKHDLKPSARKFMSRGLDPAVIEDRPLSPYSKADAELITRYLQAEVEPTNPKTFRPLNSRELGKLSSELIKLKPNGKPPIPADHPLADNGNAVNARVSYETMQGGFTVCVIVLTRKIAGPYSERLKKYMSAWETLLWRGASRRSYRDRHNQIRAEMLAFERAILCSRAERLPV